MTKDEALKMALEALEPLVRRAAPWGELDWLNGCKAITAIKEALAQPEQEPVAYVKTVIEALYENSDPVSVEAAELLERITTPPQRGPLTDEEINDIAKNYALNNPTTPLHFARAIEAAHGIRENT